jgi:hypothetical protein
MSQNQSAARTQHTRKARLPAVRRLALAAPLAAGLALAAVVIPAGMASAITCGPANNYCAGPGTPDYSTATWVSSSANPSISGQPVTFTARISPATPAGVVLQGGTVGFTDNGTPIPGCTAQPVSAATATCQATPATGTIAATFTGWQAPSGTRTRWEGSTGTMNQVTQGPAPGQLAAGQSLPAGQAVQSPNGQYTLKMQTDGNLCQYGPAGNALWCTGTYGTGSNDHLTMQTDGNLVIYNSSGTPLWQSGTGGNPGAVLTVGDDSSLAIDLPAGPVWTRNSSLTDQLPATVTPTPGHDQTIQSPNGQYWLTMQWNGDLTEWGADSAGAHTILLWATGTSNPCNDYGYVISCDTSHLTMQTDGNLVLSTDATDSQSPPAGQVLWSSGTGGHSGSAYTFDVQNDGNLVIYGPTGVLWARR